LTTITTLNHLKLLQIITQFGSMDDLPCYMGSQILDQQEDFEEDEDCNEDELETNTMDISNREC
jgi:hypothetical protein